MEFFSTFLLKFNEMDFHKKRQETTHVAFESLTWHVAFDLDLMAFTCITALTSALLHVRHPSLYEVMRWAGVVDSYSLPFIYTKVNNVIHMFSKVSQI